MDFKARKATCSFCGKEFNPWDHLDVAVVSSTPVFNTDDGLLLACPDCSRIGLTHPIEPLESEIPVHVTNVNIHLYIADEPLRMWHNIVVSCGELLDCVSELAMLDKERMDYHLFDAIKPDCYDCQYVKRNKRYEYLLTPEVLP